MNIAPHRGGRILVGLAVASIACAGCVRGPTLPTPSSSPGPRGPATSPPTAPSPTPAEPVAWFSLVPEAPVLDGFGGVGNQYIFDTAAYRDGFVAVGEDLRFDGPVDAAIWQSPDGRTWERIPTTDNALADSQIDAVAAFGDRIVAVGRARAGDADPGDGAPIVWTSDDGRDWRRAPNGGLDGGAQLDLAGGPGGFVAWAGQGSGSALYWSADGVAWTPASTGASFDGVSVRAIGARGDGFVAVGSTLPPPSNVAGGPDRTKAAAWWSPDGRTWTPSTIDDGFGLGTLDVGAGGLIAFGGGGCGGCLGPAAMWQSADGQAWRHVGNDVPGWPMYASDGGRIVRDDYQGDGDVFESTDGVSWTRIGNHGRVDEYGLTVGRHGILITESIARAGPGDEVDAGVWYLEAG